MKKTLSAVAICVGTMIGAGYASGQEVAAYFGTAPSFLVPVSCGIMMFILIAVLLGVAARTRGSTKEVNRAVFGRASVVADGAMTVNAVIVLSAMMAGADTAMKNITGAELPYGVALCLIGIYVLRRGEKGLAAANTAMVPCIVATLVAVCLYAGQDLTSAPSVKEVPFSAAYVSMNLLLGAGVLVERRGLSRRQILAAGAISAVIIAALLMVLTGCFRNVEAAYKTINWESVVLIAAMLPMSLALEKTGASAYISDSLVHGLGDYGPFALMAGIYFTTSLLTMFISNTATAVLLAPIALQSATQMGVSPVPFLFAVAVGASMCFASPFSTPPNALVMPAGQYKFIDYIKVGLPLQIIMGIVMVFALPLLFPF